MNRLSLPNKINQHENRYEKDLLSIPAGLKFIAYDDGSGTISNKFII